MQIIYFEENQKEVWNKFIAENYSESFLQSWEWGKFQERLGRKIWRIGIVGDGLPSEDEKRVSSIKYQVLSNNLITTALVIKHDLPFGKSYFYCPRGPILKVSSIKYQVSSVLDLLFKEIRKIAKEEKSLFLRIDPPISRWFHSGDSPVEPECESCAEGSTVPRRELWSQHYGFKKSPSEIQPRDTLILDLIKSEEELLKEMKQKTRYNIRLAERKELRITNYELRIDNRKIFEGKFEEFWRLIKETSARDKFASHNKDYYWKMLESLDCCNERNKNCHSEFISESIGDKDLSCFKFVEWGMERIAQDSGSKKKIPELNSGQALKQVQDDKCNCKNKLQAKLYLAEYENKIIAANIVLYFGNMAVYLHGASSNEYRNMMAPYLLQWRQILDAKKAGYKKYDFWGIACNLNVECGMWNLDSKFKIQNSKLQSWGGITRFKKGFGGEEKNYIGAYDAVFDNIGYAMYKFIKFIKYLVFSI